MGCCKSRCCNDIVPVEIFEIPSNENLNLQNESYIEPQIDLSELKDKIICDFKRIFMQLQKGYKPDLEFLLEEISLIDYNLDNKEYIVQYYLNNNE